jgi:hypothetical protein
MPGRQTGSRASQPAKNTIPKTVVTFQGYIVIIVSTKSQFLGTVAAEIASNTK